MTIRSSLLIAFITSYFFCCESVHAQQAVKLFDGALEITLPEGYLEITPPEGDREREDSNFVLYGGHSALNERFADHSFDEDFLKRWLYKDARASMKVLIADLITKKEFDKIPRTGGDRFLVVDQTDADPKVIHQQVCKEFSNRWEPYGFAMFDDETNIGGCINLAGAFVAIFMRKIDDKFVIVDTIDLVEVLIAEKKVMTKLKPFASVSDQEKWDYFKLAANWDAAKQLLLSAKLTE
jgi:hypothetical protein